MSTKTTENKRMLLLMTVILPLARGLIIRPISLIFQANSLTVAYMLISILAELASTLAFFGALALMIKYMFGERKDLVMKTFAWQSLSLILVGFLLEMLVPIALAFLDEVIAPSGFYFCNHSLTQFEDAEILTNLALYAFLSIITVFIIIPISLFICRSIKRKHPNGIDTALAAAAIVYVGVSLVMTVWDTAITLISVGTPKTLSDVVSIVSPYLKIAVFATLGWFFMGIVADHTK